MYQLGVIPSVEAFYEIFLEKWKEYLYKIKSGKHLQAVIGRNIETVEDVKEHMEDIRIYMRGHICMIFITEDIGNRRMNYSHDMLNWHQGKNLQIYWIQ